MSDAFRITGPEAAPEPQTIEGWVNVYFIGQRLQMGNIKPTKHQADKEAGSHRIDCIKIGPFKVGEGLEQTT